MVRAAASASDRSAVLVWRWGAWGEHAPFFRVTCMSQWARAALRVVSSTRLSSLFAALSDATPFPGITSRSRGRRNASGAHAARSADAQFAWVAAPLAAPSHPHGHTAPRAVVWLPRRTCEAAV
jgi:hypothetical protein